MITNVGELRLALAAYPDAMPVVSCGVDGFGSSFLAIEEDDEPVELELFYSSESREQLYAVVRGITGKYLRIAGDWSVDDTDFEEEPDHLAPYRQIETLKTIIRDLHVIMRREGWQS